jgi:hypothetical protein
MTYAFASFFLYVHTAICARLVLNLALAQWTFVDQNGTFVEDKMFTFPLECTHFIFNQCPFKTHDGANAKISTSWDEADYSALASLVARSQTAKKGHNYRISNRAGGHKQMSSILADQCCPRRWDQMRGDGGGGGGLRGLANDYSWNSKKQ